ncbi:MAG: CHAD domain-containing protein [Actinomycetota bacterium]
MEARPAAEAPVPKAEPNVEREVKLSVPPSFRMPELAAPEDGLKVLALEPQRLQTTYFDTEDLRLGRWGMSLRFRAGQGWTLKLPGKGDGPLLVRGEYTFSGDAAHPAKEALDLARASIRTARLKPVTRLRTMRRRTQLVDANGTLLAEVSDDEVSILPGRRIAARFRELEVEITDAMPTGVLDRVLGELKAAGAGEPDPTPKYVRAIGPRASEPPDVVVEPFPSHPTVGDLVRRAISESVLQLLQNDVLIRLGEDPEGVHRARVATRRLRSHLRMFGPLLEDAWNRRLRDELGWLGDVLGVSRDADVLLERMQRRVEELPEPDRASGDAVLSSLTDERARARRDLIRAIGSDRYVDLLDRLVEASHVPAFTEAAAEPASSVLPLVEAQWKSLRRRVKTSAHAPTDAELHRIRIHAKRSRYAAEAVTPVVGKHAKAFASAAADLQSVLGTHNDGVVAVRWLRDWSDGSADGARFGAGVIAGLERADANASRREWRLVWKALVKRRLSAWT